MTFWNIKQTKDFFRKEKMMTANEYRDGILDSYSKDSVYCVKQGIAICRGLSTYQEWKDAVNRYELIQPDPTSTIKEYDNYWIAATIRSVFHQMETFWENNNEKH